MTKKRLTVHSAQQFGRDRRTFVAAFEKNREFGLEAHYDMSLEILREAIVNALVHHESSLSSSIRFFRFDDRLEVHSPGKLPNRVTVANIRAGTYVERNPIIQSQQRFPCTI